MRLKESSTHSGSSFSRIAMVLPSSNWRSISIIAAATLVVCGAIAVKCDLCSKTREIKERNDHLHGALQGLQSNNEKVARLSARVEDLQKAPTAIARLLSQHVVCLGVSFKDTSGKEKVHWIGTGFQVERLSRLVTAAHVLGVISLVRVKSGFFESFDLLESWSPSDIGKKASFAHNVGS